MILKQLKIKQALNKTFLKLKPTRIEIDNFKKYLAILLNRTNDKESEEFHKNLLSDFLKDTYYKQKHFINTKGRNDLVIHNGSDAQTTVGVIIEAKKPSHKAEMITTENINKKAFQELVLYYLRERIIHKNFEIRHLIITNLYEWFIFSENLFERLFVQNKTFVKQFENFESSKKTTEVFYKEIAEPFIESITSEIEFTYFNLNEYYDVASASWLKEDNALIALFKILSPEHLLKLPFANDSNTLDQQFYNELLYILGLVEVTENGKKLIQRSPPKERHLGTILEEAIIQVDSLKKLSRVDKLYQFGNTKEEQLFNIALELSIAWINRILFLKLLEAQLVKYNRGDKSYAFLHPDKVKWYHDLDRLFFQILSRQHSERSEHIRKAFEKVPYLNSSLFEPTEIEQQTIFISNLHVANQIPIFSQTVLKDREGNRKTGNLNTLRYLLEFLDAYDFGAEGREEIQEDNKTLINASVLGLIFEKINGYKDGSFFTPGFITMYMCRESIRKAVVQAFCRNFPDFEMNTIEDIYELIPQKISRKQANQIVNSIKICDPAVGSGHFLVSALNEIISIKNDLKILEDRNGKSLHRYEITVGNDELTITDENGELFEYNPKNKESQRIQEAIFHEKQTIIENCLFGVDINPNSVKICRLRLWIELLKNAYYTTQDLNRGLETLPNIDINIKCGNSLISRFATDQSINHGIIRSKKWNIDTYRNAVATYRNTENKEQKSEIERLIAEIKSDFRAEVAKNDLRLVRKRKLEGELFNLMNQKSVFEETEQEKKEKAQKAQAIQQEIDKLNVEIEVIKANKVFENSLEWRFEFPEVLNDEGEFIGFDVVIGNPPYIQLQSMREISEYFQLFDYQTYDKMGDIYSLFYEKGNEILKDGGYLAYITSNKWMRAGYGSSLRNYFLTNTQPLLLVDLGGGVFERATVDTNIMILRKQPYESSFQAFDISKEKEKEDIASFSYKTVVMSPQKDESWIVATPLEQSIRAKIERIGKPLREWDIQINFGIKTGYNEAFVIDGKKKDELIAQDAKSAEIIKPILRGKDIKRYKTEFADVWLIATFPALKLNIDNYPAVKAYLQSFGKRLHQIGEEFIDEQGYKVQTRKKTGNKWFETQDQIAFYREFEKEKIVWKRVGSVIRFQFDDSGLFCLDSTCFLTGRNIKFLLGFLNSKVAIKQLLANAPKTGTGDVITSVQALEPILVPDLSETEQQPFIALIDEILAKKDQHQDTSNLEKQIDNMIYKLYGFTEEEIKVIEQ